MAEVRVALPAQHLHASHPVRGVCLYPDVLRRYRRPKARPPGAGIELGIGLEQGRAAADALVSTVLMIVPMLPGERRLGAFAPRHRILLRRQLLTPLFICLLDFRHVLLYQIDRL